MTPPIILIITYPSDGGTINRRDVMVKGIVITNMGNETGVTVNGMVAMVYGAGFVVNHVPLTEGSNTITATATDVVGNIEIASISVISSPGEHYVNITANTESGIPPLEVILTIESTLDLTNATLTYTGPAEVEFISVTASEYAIMMNTEGIYYFTASVNDSNGGTYFDVIAITVLFESEMDALLRNKLEQMKQALRIKDVEKAVSHFVDGSSEIYRYNFDLMKDILPTIVQDMGNIELLTIEDRVAEYEMIVMQDEIEYSVFIRFIKDFDGLWKIDFF